MTYWFSGDNYNCNRALAKKLTEFLRTEKRNWRRSVFHIDDDSTSNDTAPLIANFINAQKLDVIVVLRNYHLPDITFTDTWTEICTSKGKTLLPQLKHNIQLDTAFTTVQEMFLKLITEI